MAKIRTTHWQPYSIMFKSSLAGFVLLALAHLTQAEVAPESASRIHAVKTAQSKGWMAVTANPYASDAAAAILSQGGSAVDAAIAAQLVLGLTEPQSSGIGGGAFLLHWHQDKKMLSHFDGRETAPKAINPQHFLIKEKAMPFFDAVVGGHAVGVPGIVHMLEAAHKQYGKLSWDKLFLPAIDLATNGFIVSERLHSLLLQTAKHPATMQQKAFVSYFYPNGQPVPVGEKLKNPAYVRTLQLIANKGAGFFYQGEIADAIVSAVKTNSVRQGLLDKSDLATYRSIENKALCSTVKPYQLCGSPPPSSGPFTVMQIAALMHNLPDAKKLNSDSYAFYHRYTEALKLAMADRNAYIADPAFIAMPLTQLLNPDYLKQRATLIPLKHASKKPAEAGKVSVNQHYQAGLELEQPSTTHLSIVDSEGNWLSMTSSIEMAFGSRIMVEGFLLNNQLTDFSFYPEDAKGLVANRIEAGKRPRSSMAPMLIFNAANEPIMAIGSPGGSRIISYVAKTLMQSLYGQLSVANAVASPQLTVFNNVLELENVPQANTLADSLRKREHTLRRVDQTSGLHIIYRDGEQLIGVADGRREGVIRHQALN